MIGEENVKKGSLARIIDGPLKGEVAVLTGRTILENRWRKVEAVVGGVKRWVRLVNLKPYKGPGQRDVFPP